MAERSIDAETQAIEGPPPEGQDLSAMVARPQLVAEAMRQYQRPLGVYARKLCHGSSRYEDIVQETFLRLMSAARPPDHLGQWLFTVCRNLAFDIHRKEGRMSTMDLSIADGRGSTQATPAALAEHREQASLAMRAMDDLPDNQQEVVRLKFQNGFSYRQIAGITGLSVTNVGFLIHTAIQTMRRRMGVVVHPTA